MSYHQDHLALQSVKCQTAAPSQIFSVEDMVAATQTQQVNSPLLKSRAAGYREVSTPTGRCLKTM